MYSENDHVLKKMQCLIFTFCRYPNNKLDKSVSYLLNIIKKYFKPKIQINSLVMKINT